MRNEFELEREGYAVTERDLRARLATEAERYQALEAAQHAIHEHLNALRAQNEALQEAYGKAKRLAADLARGAGELATAFEKTVPDVPPMPEIKLPAKESSKSAKKSRDEAPVGGTSAADHGEEAGSEDDDDHAHEAAHLGSVGRYGAKA
jgi:septal ring factor EnvC (AmiA/AmiB activator)